MILIVSPALDGSLLGNGVTTGRWRTILEQLGHTVTSARSYDDGDFQLLVALHARKSADSVRRFRQAHPAAPIVLALTGTDLYPDLATAGVDPSILELADRFVVLQESGLDQLGPGLRSRGRVIVQSLPAIASQPPPAGVFQVAFLAHLREVKDPLRPAAAAHLLPSTSRIRIVHAGEDLEPELGKQARVESERSPRYDWVGPLPREEALALLARSSLFVLTSWHEGGANVVTEALAAGVPIICSEIPGSVGLLGRDYPGYFPPGDTVALAELLSAAETDTAFYGSLRDHCSARRPLVHPDRERAAWAALLEELSVPPSAR